MKIVLKRIDKGLPLPEIKGTEMVFTCRKDTIIETKDLIPVPANVIVKPGNGLN